MFGRGIYLQINARYKENIHLDMPCSLHHHYVREPQEIFDLSNVTCLEQIFHFFSYPVSLSVENFLFFCFIGFESGSTSRRFLITSWEISGMSVADHAKTSLFFHRNFESSAWTSLESYIHIWVVLSTFFSQSGTDIFSSTGLSFNNSSMWSNSYKGIYEALASLISIMACLPGAF